MNTKHGFKNITKKGGESAMKKTIVLLMAVAMLFGVQAVSWAATTQSIGVSVTIPAPGVSIPSGKTILRCPGTMPTSGDPWTYPGCVKNLTTMDFGTLTHLLSDGKGAGCFFGPNYFIVYLYPDVWGGVGYEITQSFSWTTAGFPSSALVMTAVYSREDRYDLNGDGDVNDPGETPQGDKPAAAVLGNAGLPQLAAGGVRQVYKSEKPGSARIVRAQYGLPPYPGTDATLPENNRPTGWAPVPLTLGQGTYSGTATITITAY